MTRDFEIYNNLMEQLTGTQNISDFEFRNQEIKRIEAEAERHNQGNIVAEAKKMRRQHDFSKLARLRQEGRKEEALTLLAYIRQEWTDMKGQENCDQYERAINGE